MPQLVFFGLSNEGIKEKSKFKWNSHSGRNRCEIKILEDMGRDGRKQNKKSVGNSRHIVDI